MTNTNHRNSRNTEIEYSITARIGVITEYSTGWTKELNIVSWNGGAPKFDIRDWDSEHEHMSRGITLHEDEARTVSNLILDWLDGVASRRNGAQKPARGNDQKDQPSEESAGETLLASEADAIDAEIEIEVDEETGEVMEN